jgi:hypothetical protein
MCVAPMRLAHVFGVKKKQLAVHLQQGRSGRGMYLNESNYIGS